jgi:Ankyrin repeats (3 copies)
MQLNPLPFHSTLDPYRRQAEELLEGWRSGDAEAIRVFRSNLPQFLDDKIPWLPKNLSESDLRNVHLELADAQLALARSYSFQSWARLSEWLEAVARPGSDVAIFETAVEAVIGGDSDTLRRLLQEHPELVRARSTIVTHHDPPVHGATLLHYVAANGVEGYRQKTPPNAVEIAKLLLDAGAAPDALAAMYGGQCTTMSMLVSSSHPANAGVQVALVDTLLDYGASAGECGSGAWTSPLMTALVFGYTDAAEALVRRGAPVNTLPAAAALGLLDESLRLLPGATKEDRHRALALAAQLGRVEIVRMLLDAGEDPNRYNPEGSHTHSTPLHQAVWAGHEATVRLLVERGARMDLEDKIWKGTPLGWAEHGGREQIADYLRQRQQKHDATG